MPTHYHLFGWFEDNMLSTAIHRLNRRYAVAFNGRYKRRGHVFDSPFTSTEVTSEQHAYHLPDYIAENPPRRPWPWSSYDATFDFVTPLPWFERQRPGSANQVANATERGGRTPPRSAPAPQSSRR